MKKITFLLTTILFFSFVSVQTALAIGMMTKPIVIENVLRGQDVVATLTLRNSDEREVTYGFKAEGQVADWATFFNIKDKNLENPITEIKMPVKEYIDIVVKFTIPRDTPNGEYTGELFVSEDLGGKVNSDEASVGVSQKIGREVTIAVTDKEIVQFKTTFVPKTYDVQNGKPLIIRVLYNNQGNVSVKPDLQLKITRDGATVYNAIFPYPEAEDAVRAYSEKEISSVEWQTSGQENGIYKAELKVLLNGQVISEDDFRFSIGYFKGSMWISAISFLGGGNLGIGWVVLGAMLLAIVALLSFFEKKGMGFTKVLNSVRRLF